MTINLAHYKCAPKAHYLTGHVRLRGTPHIWDSSETHLNDRQTRRAVDFHFPSVMLLLMARLQSAHLHTATHLTLPCPWHSSWVLPLTNTELEVVRPQNPEHIG
jgi:hypothetical protein